MLPNKIKWNFKGQWRKFSITWPDEDKLGHLLRKLDQLQEDPREAPIERSVVLHYEDEEKDLITIANEAELIESFEHANEGGVLKLFVREKESRPDSSVNQGKVSESAESGNKPGPSLSMVSLKPPVTENWALERYRGPEPHAEEHKESTKSANGQSGWRRFSEQEKLAVRKNLHAVDGVLEVMRPDPVIKITRIGNESGNCSGGILSLLSGCPPGQNYTITREREGFGMNATTAQVGVHVIGAIFESYVALTDGGDAN